ncbi:hypothetical protein V1515DRAFT_115006 [Lipomyces mesembrius]
MFIQFIAMSYRSILYRCTVADSICHFNDQGQGQYNRQMNVLDDDSRQNSVDYKPTGSASFAQLSRIESITQTTYDRQSFSLPASRSQSLSLSLHFARPFGSGQHNLSCMEEPSTPTSTLMTLDISENLNGIVLELVREAVRSPEYIDKMANLNIVMLGQRIISIRKLTAEITGKWVLTADVLTEVVHTLFNRGGVEK